MFQKYSFHALFMHMQCAQPSIIHSSGGYQHVIYEQGGSYFFGLAVPLVEDNHYEHGWGAAGALTLGRKQA